MQEDSSNETCGCLNRKIIHIFDAVVLMAAMLTQAGLLNWFLISSCPDTCTGNYVWIAADMMCVLVFAITMIKSYYFMYFDDGSVNNQRSKGRFRRMTGIMPYSYISWLFYSVIVLGKILSIVTLERTTYLVNFSPHALTITIAISLLVFLLLVEVHNCAGKQSEQHAFITTLTTKTCLEILDCASIFGILLDPTLSGNSESINSLRSIIMALFTITFLLPTLALYKLSLSEFAAKKFPLSLVLVYHFLHLLFLDFAFLSLRVYLWVVHEIRSSVLIIKNVVAIFFATRNIYPDVRELVAKWKRKKVHANSHIVVSASANQSCDCDDPTIRSEILSDAVTVRSQT